jgi:glycosyltransferase involved in cell wall biosynthesis
MAARVLAGSFLLSSEMTSSTFPLVSIITPVYNGAKYLDDLILSVRNQDYPNFEHIIIDDGSTDGDATIGVLDKYPHLRWWTRPNRGQYATMNEGLDAANGDFVCFVCADDKLDDDAISKAMVFFRHHPECDGLYGYTGFFRENGDPYVTYLPFSGSEFKFYPYFSHVSHCSFYFKRKVIISQHLYFDETLRYVGDYEWFIRMVNGDIKIGVLKETLSWVRFHDNQTSTVQYQEMKNEQLMIVEKYRLNKLKLSIYFNLVIWINNCFKLFFTLKQKGIGGAAKLVVKWLQKHSFIIKRNDRFR